MINLFLLFFHSLDLVQVPDISLFLSNLFFLANLVLKHFLELASSLFVVHLDLRHNLSKWCPLVVVQPRHIITLSSNGL